MSTKTKGDFFVRYGPWAVVAGGSTGLGEAWSTSLAKRGLNIVVIGRREAPLRALETRLKRRFGVQVVTRVGDLSVEEDLLAAVASLGDFDIGCVVFNAGLSPSGGFAYLPRDQVYEALRTNVIGPTLFVHGVLPQLMERSHAGIVLVSSLAGYCGSPKLQTYAATKAYLRVLGEGLWVELRDRHVDVLVTTPGAITTPGLQERSSSRIVGQMSPNAVAERSLRHLGRGPVYVPGLMNNVGAVVLSRVLPHRRAIAMMDRASSTVS